MLFRSLVSCIVIVLFCGGFLGWAALAPLQSAAIAIGELGVETNRKTVKHLEGGIIAAILVKDGQRVTAGQTLLRLDRTRARASLEQVRPRFFGALALEARLIAERDGASEIRFPTRLLSAVDLTDAKMALAGEQNIFDTRRRAVRNRTAIIYQRIAQLEEEIVGLEGQAEAESTELALIAEELRAQERLVERKLAGEGRTIQLRRQAARINGDRARHQAAISRVRQSIAEQRLKIGRAHV